METYLKSGNLAQLVNGTWRSNVICGEHPDRGVTLLANKAFDKHQFVCEYEGDLITVEEAERREERYAADGKGCYLLYFTGKDGTKYVRDPTGREVPGKYISHSKSPNLYTHLYTVEEQPRIVLCAKEHIDAGVELFFDYWGGGRTPKDIPWAGYRREVCMIYAYMIILPIATYWITSINVMYTVYPQQPAIASTSATGTTARRALAESMMDLEAVEEREGSLVIAEDEWDEVFSGDDDMYDDEEPEGERGDGERTVHQRLDNTGYFELRDMLSHYSTDEKVYLLQSIVTVRKHNALTIALMVEALAASTLKDELGRILTGRPVSAHRADTVTAIYDKAGECNTEVHPIITVVRLLCMGDGMETLTTAMDELESPTKVKGSQGSQKAIKESQGSHTSRPASAPTTPQKAKRSRVSGNDDYRRLTRNEHKMHDWRMNLIPTDCRGSMYTHQSVEGQNRYKFYILVIGGRRLSTADCAAKMQVANNLDVMGILAVMDNDPEVNAHGVMLSESTYLVIGLARLTTFNVLLQSVYGMVQAVIEESDMDRCIVAPLTREGYDWFLKEMEEAPDRNIIGNIDEKSRKRLGLQEPEVRDTFIKLVDYLEQARVKTHTEIVNLLDKIEPGDKMFKVIGTLRDKAHAMKSSVEISLWYLQQRKKYLPPHISDNGSLLSGRLWHHVYKKYCKERRAGELFTWDDLLDRVWFIENVLAPQTACEQLLIGQGIQPQRFVNDLLEMLVHQTRRHRCIVLYSKEKMCGKSILVDAILQLFNGKRMCLDHYNGREFTLGSCANAGCVVVEDPGRNGLLYMEGTLRAHVDGDAVPINEKNRAIYERRFPPMFVTTNCEHALTLFLTRAKHYTFTKQIGTIFKTRKVDSIPPSDIALMICKYTIFPMCAAMYKGYIPFKQTGLTQCSEDVGYGHSPFCRQMLYLSRIEKMCPPVKERFLSDAGLIEIDGYERIRPHNVGITITNRQLTNADTYMQHVITREWQEKHPCQHSEDTEAANKACLFVRNALVPISAAMNQCIEGESQYMPHEIEVPFVGDDIWTSETFRKADLQARETAIPEYTLISEAEKVRIVTNLETATETCMKGMARHARLSTIACARRDVYNMMTGKTQMSLRDADQQYVRQTEDMFG